MLSQQWKEGNDFKEKITGSFKTKKEIETFLLKLEGDYYKSARTGMCLAIYWIWK